MNAIANYAVCLLLIHVSGNPAVRTLGYELNMVVLFAVSAALFFLRRRRLGLGAVRFAVAVAALLFVQIVIWGDVAIFASIGFYLQILSAMLIAAAIPRFPRVMVNSMAMIAALSLVFYFVIYLPGNLDAVRPLTVYEDTSELNIGLHNFRGFGYEVARNSGPFWEPGAFAGYLAFALFLLVLSRDSSKLNVPIVIVLVVALLTTLSTMGYAALFVVMVAALIRTSRALPPVIGLLLLPFVLSAMVLTAWTVSEQLPFLKEKITEQFEETEEGEDNSEINRFGNAVFDWEFIVRRPLFGWSASTDTRAADRFDAEDFIANQGNELTGMAARFGFVGWFLFMGRFFFNVRRLSGSVPVAAVSIGLIAVMFTGEKYMNYPLIMTLFFLEPYHMAGERVMRVRRLRRVRRPTRLTGAATS